jgi:hypothetical protein
VGAAGRGAIETSVNCLTAHVKSLLPTTSAQRIKLAT